LPLLKLDVRKSSIKVKELALKADISHSLVSGTIHGKINNRRALQALLDAGCPAKLLALPADMKGKKAA
jgi:hypothetical protein